MTIEADALVNAPDIAPSVEAHGHEDMKTITVMPRVEQGLLHKARAWLTGDKSSNMPIVRKDAEGLRYMFLITSNAYQDREGETITSAALKAYEASCYPGGDLFHCDNPLLWWHDDEIVMGTIEGVEYVEPFLIEVAKELPNDPLSKLLWDYAERNGDNAGTSHRFGYLDKDRDPDGTFHRIFKQETSYLPERALAANDRTYAGVLNTMSIPESRKRLGKIVEEATGLKDLSELIHTDIAAAKKRLSEMGLQHKATKPPFPPQEATAEAVAEEVAEDEVEEEVKAEDMPSFMAIMNQISTLVMDLVDSQMGQMGQQQQFAKSLEAMQKSLDERLVSEKASKKTLEDQVKMLTTRVELAEKRLSLAPRSVTQDKGETDPEKAKEAIDAAVMSEKESKMVIDPFYGPLKPLPKD